MSSSNNREGILASVSAIPIRTRADLPAVDGITRSNTPESPAFASSGGSTPDSPALDGAGRSTPALPVSDGTGRTGSTAMALALALALDGTRDGIPDSDEDMDDDDLEDRNDAIAHSQSQGALLQVAANLQGSAWDSAIDGPDYAELCKSIPTDGFLRLIDAIWNDEKLAGSAIARPHQIVSEAEQRFAFRTWSCHTLCSMPEDLVRILIYNNVSRADLHSDVRKYLRDCQQIALEQPSIYVRSWVDQEGDSPTVTMLLGMADFVTNYCDLTLSLRSEQYRNLLEFERKFDDRRTLREVRDGTRHFTPVQTKKFVVWAAALKRRCMRVDKSKWSDPLPDPPITYTGYSKRVSNRFQSHEQMKTTSIFNQFIITYFEMIVGSDEYSFDNKVVCVLASPKQLAMAEITVAAIARSNYRYGGCCAAAPGNNMGSKSEDEYWNKHEQTMMRKTPLAANWKLEAKRLKEYVTRTDPVRQEEERLLKEIEELEETMSRRREAVFKHAERVSRLRKNHDHLVSAGAGGGEMMQFAGSILKSLEQDSDKWVAFFND